MSFLKISDSKKRDEIVIEFIERKQRIHQHSINHNLSDASFQRDLTKMYKPLLDSNSAIKESLKGADHKLSEGMLAITNSSLALTSSSFPSTTPEMLTDDKQKFMNVGKIAARYLKMLSSSKNQIDKTFGVHLKDGELFLGKDPIMLNDDDIVTGDNTYHGTAGLWKLITKNEPNDAIYNDEDLKNYRETLLDARAIIFDSNPNNPKASRSTKYKELVKPVWDEVKLKNKGKKSQVLFFFQETQTRLLKSWI